VATPLPLRPESAEIRKTSGSVEPGYLRDPAQFSVLKSATAVPLVGTRGVIGVLTLYSRAKDSFTRDHLRLLNAVSSKAP
jgi:GAF domain-containing protein